MSYSGLKYSELLRIINRLTSVFYDNKQPADWMNRGLSHLLVFIPPNV